MPKISLSLDERFKTNVSVRGHTVRIDEPADKGGDDTGPTPGELLIAAVGSCMAITMRLYADRKQWPLEGVDIEMESTRKKADECPDYDNPDGRKEVTVITSSITLRGPLTKEQKLRIAEIGGRCPVHKTVADGAHFIDELAVD